MNMTTSKKVLLVTVACVAVLALMAGVAVAVTGANAGVGVEAEACERKNDCAEEGECARNETMRVHRDEVRGEIASLLGLSLEEMTAELASGKNMAELADEKGVTIDQVLETITRKVGEVLDAEVAAGNMTPEKAEERKSQAVSRAASRIEKGREKRENCTGENCTGMRGQGMGQRGERMGPGGE